MATMASGTQTSLPIIVNSHRINVDERDDDGVVVDERDGMDEVLNDITFINPRPDLIIAITRSTCPTLDPNLQQVI